MVATLVNHVVLFKLKNDVSNDSIYAFYAGAKGLSSIPGVVDVTVGPQDSSIYDGYTPRNADYTHALVVTFTDATALRDYVTHPQHEAFVEEHVSPNCEGVLAVDFHSERAASGYRRCPVTKALCVTSAAVVVGSILLSASMFMGRCCRHK